MWTEYFCCHLENKEHEVVKLCTSAQWKVGSCQNCKLLDSRQARSCGKKVTAIFSQLHLYLLSFESEVVAGDASKNAAQTFFTDLHV